MCLREPLTITPRCILPPALAAAACGAGACAPPASLSGRPPCMLFQERSLGAPAALRFEA